MAEIPRRMVAFVPAGTSEARLNEARRDGEKSKQAFLHIVSSFRVADQESRQTAREYQRFVSEGKISLGVSLDKGLDWRVAAFHKEFDGQHHMFLLLHPQFHFLVWSKSASEARAIREETLSQLHEAVTVVTQIDLNGGKFMDRVEAGKSLAMLADLNLMDEL